MKKSARVIAALLCLTMVLVTFSACSTGSDSPGTTVPGTTTAAKTTTAGTKATTTTAQVPVDPFAKHLDISWVTNYAAGLPETFKLKTELEEKFNVSIDIPDVDTNADWATFLLIVAAGDMPDAGFYNIGIDMVLQWYDEEVIRDFPKESIRTFLPDYAAALDTYAPAGWDLYNVDGKPDDTMAMTGMLFDYHDILFHGSTYRYDWLQKLGIEPNGNVHQLHPGIDYVYVTDVGFTQEQFLDIMEQFKNGDPDGNGIADTVPIAACDTVMGQHSLQGVGSIFGLASGNNLEEDGKTINYYSSVKYKEFLKFAAELYAKGYVDQDFLSTPWARNNEKMSSGKYGYFATPFSYACYTPTGRAEKTGGWARGPSIGIADNPEGKILLAPHETGASGKSYSAWNAASPLRYAMTFNMKCDDEKMERIMAMINYSFFNRETSEKFYRGVEGVNYNMVDDGFGGKMVVSVPTTELADADKGVYIFNSGMARIPDDRWDFLPNFLSKALNEYLLSDVMASGGYGPYRLDLYNETKLAAMNKEYNANITTIVNEYQANAIAGNVNIEETWSKYLADLDKAGYQSILTELNKAPLYTDNFPNKQGLK